MSERAPVAVVGACGRMGQAVTAALGRTSDFCVAYQVDPGLRSGQEAPRGGPDLDGLKPGEVAGIIDFSSAAGAIAAAVAAKRLRCALVSGTTAIDERGREAQREAARVAPVCWAPNFSIGIPLLAEVLRQAAERLPAGWQVEISETHHAGKRDAPSGTALRLAEIWKGVRGGRFVHGREGTPGPRAPEEIGLHALRVGDVVGEHRVLLGGSGEVLELLHRMQDRSAFAAGSIEALRRLLRKGPGMYEWSDLLCRA